MQIAKTRAYKRNPLHRESKLNLICLALLGFFTLYPFLYLLAVSISDPAQMSRSTVYLLPKGFSLKAYADVFKDAKLLNGFKNTLIIAAMDVSLGVVCTMMMAYPLAMRGYFTKYSNIIMKFVLVTMYFSGGLIPSYLLMKNLGLINSFWALALPGAVSSFHLIIARTYIRDSIPADLYDASSIDGANEAETFIKIVIPLSMPIIAVIILYRTVGAWNSFFSPLLYLNSPGKYPLQIYLRELLLESEMVEYREIKTKESFSSTSLKAAVLVVSTAPILIGYPFLQKYFVKGITIGAIKG